MEVVERGKATAEYFFRDKKVPQIPSAVVLAARARAVRIDRRVFQTVGQVADIDQTIVREKTSIAAISRR
jgi:hypothetical protein